MMYETKAPSRIRIPQRCPEDRRNAREATLAVQREAYRLHVDDLPGDPEEGFRLPGYLAQLPKAEHFTVRKLVDLFGQKVRGQLNGALLRGRPRTMDGYRRACRLFPAPARARHWNDDVEFARLRLCGMNPMHLRMRHTGVTGVLEQTASAAMARHGASLAGSLDRGRVFEADYSVLADERVQKYAAARGRFLAAPRCLFFLDERDVLRPAGIVFPKDRSCGRERAYGPQDDPWAWTLAKWHAQAADSVLHEGFYHLFETHLVTEFIAVCAARQLHADHPVTQLLRPHFEFNLVIGVVARMDMLAPGKAVDLAAAPGSAGTLNVARILLRQGWRWKDRRMEADLRDRGLNTGRVERYPYRDYGLRLHAILADYTRGVMGCFYRSDADVAGDYELAAWLAETSAKLPGFPAGCGTRDELFGILTEIIFRASVQHAAVNNGQFDSFGHAPTAPGAMYTAPPDRLLYSEAEAMAALPYGDGLAAQIGMAWTLSQRPRNNLYGLGEVPAFASGVEPRAAEAVAVARRRLTALSEEMDARESTEQVPYRYLDPRNVERSAGT